MAAFIGLTVYGLARRSAWAFAGVWFFVILSPSSSFIPLEDMAVEHRLYLPLAGVIAAVVISIAMALQQDLPAQAARCFGAILLLVIAGLFAWCTSLRNTDYHDPISMWQKTAEQNPYNARAHNNLGALLLRAGEPRRAIKSLRASLQLLGDYPHTQKKRLDTLQNLGQAHELLGDFDSARMAYGAVLKHRPRSSVIWTHLGDTHIGLGETGRALLAYEEALALDPRAVGARFNFGFALERSGRIDDAFREYNRVIQENPANARLRLLVGDALLRHDRVQDAINQFQKGLQLEPTNQLLQQRLAAAQGQPQETE